MAENTCSKCVSFLGREVEVAVKTSRMSYNIYEYNKILTFRVLECDPVSMDNFLPFQATLAALSAHCFLLHNKIYHYFIQYNFVLSHI
jgi:hypothetical protein